MNSTTVNDEVNFDDLYPALVSCFINILLGYLAGRINLLSEIEAKGIHTFISNFALPSLIFTHMVEMDLSSVNWKFLLAILLGKTIIFFAVILFLLLVRRPLDIASAGILAIFSTQSNDLAIGYPIVTALYQKTHPDYANYMYLVAPINLAILNPIGFLMIEISSDRVLQSLDNPDYNRCRKIVTLMKNVISNPIILMTLLGIVFNFIFKQSIPVYIKELLEVLGSAFPACALFVLGLRMVGKVRNLQGVGFMLPGLLILAKLLALPELIRQFTIILKCGIDEKDTTEWSTFGFFYGTIPAAPVVFIFAAQYNVNADLIATSMVACTFFSAPLMFVSAKMISLTRIDPSQYLNQIISYTFDISIASLVAAVWVLIIFLIAKKIHKIPHRFTTCLLLSQIIACIGAILWNYVDYNSVGGSVQFCLFTGGIFSSRMWTAIIAVTLLFMESRHLCFILFKLQPYFFLVGWGIPLLLTGLLLLEKPAANTAKNPYFAYGIYQAIVAVSLLVLCFVVTVGSLVLHQRYKKRQDEYGCIANANGQQSSDGETSSILPATSTNSVNCGENCCSANCNGNGSNKYGSLPTINEGSEDSPNRPVVDIEDLFIETSNEITADDRAPLCEVSCPVNLTREERTYCQGIISQYQEPVDEDLELIEEERSSHNPQILRHCVLLILLLVSMFIGLTVSIWTLVMEQMTGIYVELAFLDITMNLGQSLLIFTVFGMDTKDIILPLLKKWRNLLYKEKKLILPMQSELSSETLHICDQFTKYHLDNCKADIEKNKRWRWKVYERVFTGKDFVDWLIKIGLARDRIDGVNYARHLVEGRVIRHINGIYHFYDRNLLYTFN